MWIKDNLIYERIIKLKKKEESIVAIKVGYPNQKRFNVIGYYRQWSDVFDNKPFERLSQLTPKLTF